MIWLKYFSVFVSWYILQISVGSLDAEHLLKYPILGRVKSRKAEVRQLRKVNYIVYSHKFFNFNAGYLAQNPYKSLIDE